MRYFRAYEAVFANRRWVSLLLTLVVCQFVPILGPIVMLGYLYEAVQIMYEDGDDVFPDFDMSRLMPYLIRGLWVFLVQLVVGLTVGLVFALLGVGILVSVLSTQDPAVAVVAVVAFFVSLLLFSVLLSLVMIPLTLRAGLTQDFGAAFSWRFVKDFMKRMWLPTLLSQLFLLVMVFPVLIGGMLLCFVGIYPAMTLQSLAQVHLHYQLYEEYLQRGGEVILIPQEKPPDYRDDEDYR